MAASSGPLPRQRQASAEASLRPSDREFFKQALSAIYEAFEASKDAETGTPNKEEFTRLMFINLHLGNDVEPSVEEPARLAFEKQESRKHIAVLFNQLQENQTLAGKCKTVCKSVGYLLIKLLYMISPDCVRERIEDRFASCMNFKAMTYYRESPSGTKWQFATKLDLDTAMKFIGDQSICRAKTPSFAQHYAQTIAQRETERLTRGDAPSF